MKEDFFQQKSRHLAHEVKNQLSLIDIYTKIIEKTSDENESVKKATKVIFGSISNITKLLDEFKGMSTLNLSVYNLSDIIAEIIEETNELATNSNIKILSNTIDTDIFIDKSSFKNILLNIIKNAVEAFDNTNKKEKFIKINVQTKDKRIFLTIENNGKMIEKNYQKTIFDEGFTTKSTGSGLGLYICKQNLKLQNCNLSLLKSDKNSTIFEISTDEVEL